MVRAAAATKDGREINQHFGRAEQFRVYEVESGTIRFLETRTAVPACSSERRHYETAFEPIIGLLSDCQFVLVQKIGNSPAAMLGEKGIRVFEAEGGIEEVLGEMLRDGIFKD